VSVKQYNENSINKNPNVCVKCPLAQWPRPNPLSTNKRCTIRAQNIKTVDWKKLKRAQTSHWFHLNGQVSMGTEKNNYSYQLRRILSNHLGDSLLPLSATVCPLANVCFPFWLRELTISQCNLAMRSSTSGHHLELDVGPLLFLSTPSLKCLHLLMAIIVFKHLDVLAFLRKIGLVGPS